MQLFYNERSGNTVKLVKSKFPWDQLLCSEYTDGQYLQVKLTNMVYNGIIFSSLYTGFRVIQGSV